jgi:hypothetical protein
VAEAADGGADEARWAAGAIVFDSPSRGDWAMSGSEERMMA